MGPHPRRAVVLTALALSGCSRATDDLPRQPVSGQVTLNAQPLSQGTIQFQPGAGAGGSLMSGGAMIKDGSYSIPRDQGLVPGNYRVSISAAGAGAPATKEEAPGKSPTLLPDLIPPRYNVQTTLSAEVKSDGPNAFNFDLKK